MVNQKTSPCSGSGLHAKLAASASEPEKALFLVTIPFEVTDKLSEGKVSAGRK